MNNNKKNQNQDQNKLEQLTFKELKNELQKSDGNPVRENIIRQLMKNKYIKYIKYKKSLGITTKDIENCTLNNDDFNQLNVNKVKTLNELDTRHNNKFDKKFDKKFDIEIKRDSLNNNLMDRLNGDLYIKNVLKLPSRSQNASNTINDINNNINGNMNKYIHKPYEEINNTNTSFVPFNDSNIIPNNDFSNKRLVNNF
jgi:hypothetical protein